MAAKAKTDPNIRLTAELLESAKDMRAIGVMDDATYEKITLRHLGADKAPTAAPITADDIRALRERAHMSQAVFARHLNLTAGYVSQLERGAKHPTGAALALLNVIKRKGIEAIL
jgi:putative transcriptional regulator